MSETKKPKYKVEPIPGIPEWFTPGIVCRVRDHDGEEWREPRAINGFVGPNLPFQDSDGISWRFAEPVVVEEWEPQEGEFVAVWDNGDHEFRINRYCHLSEVRSGYVVGNLTWNHIARLVYPDGRVIDCACDVETLKTRTEFK